MKLGGSGYPSEVIDSLLGSDVGQIPVWWLFDLAAKYIASPSAVALFTGLAMDFRDAIVSKRIAVVVFDADDSLVSFGASHVTRA
jgi:hypothetical protein